MGMNDMTDRSGTVVNQESRPVLVAVDFSPDSAAAVVWAARYVACCQMPLIVLHVVHDPTYSPGFYRNSKDDFMQPMQTVAGTMMDEFMAKMRDEHPGLGALNTAETRLVPGLPPSRIVEVAELLHSGLIVVGSRGISGLPQMLLGSVAERVVELASIPVVVVKSRENATLSKKEIKRAEKRLKKEKKKLKSMLGLEPQASSEEEADG
jgi:nucleotide-binding universal stress UspA family protein